MTALALSSLLLCLPLSKGKARQVALSEREFVTPAVGPLGRQSKADAVPRVSVSATHSRSESVTYKSAPQAADEWPAGLQQEPPVRTLGNEVTATARSGNGGSTHSLRFLARHTNSVLAHKCLPQHQSLPRSWSQARLWHRLAHRAKKATCAPPTPWPAWWYSQAMCIHRHEAVDWHEASNPSSRGGMQIQYGTWASVGGRGDPADASPAEQLYRAYLIWKRDGGSWREWTTAPLCGL